ncbi:hypothetical protein [Siccirubricoccus phaeus]|uniref:hypothetical protein n=1 Tax=Siccirubricoccus phaeus TaxID=2595053 RepID=UPI0011F3C9D7|nr:hypothetical protein [Siccirubricoccus phaeus]
MDGEQQTLYSWQSARCEDEYIPDSPARAFRRADGQVALIATHRENWMMVGPDFTQLRPVCRSILPRAAYQPLGLNLLWIQGIYTPDGRHVAALLSHDRSAPTKRAGCVPDPSRRTARCWLNDILAAVSDDMGESFRLLPPGERLVASLGDAYPSNGTHRFGVFTLSNIAQGPDGFHYVIAAAEGDGIQRPGNCLLRSQDPMRPELWRAWDGTDFTVDMRHPGTPQPCAVLPSASLPSEVRSLLWDARQRSWIAVFQTRRRDPASGQAWTGIAYSVSPDLFRWGPPVPLLQAPTRAREGGARSFIAYPSLIDPASRSRNFDTLEGDAPLLTFAVRHLDRAGRGSMNRDIGYVRLRVQ